MGRQVPTTDEPCDGCGKSEAKDNILVFDFMGDCICDECIENDLEPGEAPAQRIADEACCENEKRSFEGGCVNCGAPCL